MGIPKDGVGMKISSRIKPKVKLLLSLPFATSIYIGVHGVRLTRQVSQELIIYLIMPCTL